MKTDDVMDRANGVAFNFTLATFPAILFTFTLIPYLPISDIDLMVLIMDFLEEVLPEDMYSIVAYTLNDIISKPRGGLLSFGFLFAFFTATNGMLALMRAFNRCYRTVEKRSFFKTRGIAAMLTVLLAFVLLTAVILFLFGQIFLRMMDEFFTANYFVYTIILLRFLIVFFIFFIAISFIYFYAPAVTNRWRFFSIGGFLSSLLALGVSFAFSYYLSNFSTYNKLYGSIGALIALMLWFYLISIILLLGYELNASLDKAKLLYLKKRSAKNQLQ